MIKINDVDIPVSPSAMSVTVSDVDDQATTTRTMDGLLHRDRITVKRKIELEWNALEWSDVSAILQMITDTFFDVSYPDPLGGVYQKKTFYVGDRTAPIAFKKGDKIIWNGMKLNFIER